MTTPKEALEEIQRLTDSVFNSPTVEAIKQRCAEALASLQGEDAVERVARNANRIWFDTEFIEDGQTIDLISIGMVRSDGATYYAETDQWIPGKASQWVKDNVLVHLKGGDCIKPRDVIAREIVEFAGEKPEFWAYYADYDWVALCQLFGTMMQLPDGWPKFCRDIKQKCVDLGNPQLPAQSGVEHHALADALWNKKAWEFIATGLVPDEATVLRETIRHQESWLETYRADIKSLEMRIADMPDEAAIRADEREKCAKVAEQSMLPCDVSGSLILDRYTADTIATAIRSGGGD